MKKVKSFFFTAILAVMCAGLNSCDPPERPDGENPPNVIEAKNVIGNTDNVDSVKAMIYDFENEKEYVISSTKFENGGFKLTLPSTVLYLNPISFMFDPDEVIISNMEAKHTILGSGSIGGFDVAGEHIGEFSFYPVDNYNLWSILYYVYLDRDCTIKTPSNYDEYTVDCSFKKGWNVLYLYESDNPIYTTTKPSEVNLKWYYYEY